MTRTKSTLHEDQCIFLTISCPVLLRMRNVSDKSCRENQNTCFIFNNFFLKIVPFMRPCAKILYNRPGHRKQYGSSTLHVGYLWLQMQTQNAVNTYCFFHCIISGTKSPQCYFTVHFLSCCYYSYFRCTTAIGAVFIHLYFSCTFLFV